MAVGALGLLTGACGGGTKSAGVPGAGVPRAGAVVSSTTASSGPYRQPHTSRAGAGGATTTSRTASTPGSSRPASSAGPQQSEELKLARCTLRFSQCMRSHGVPNFPDPTTGPIGEQLIVLHGRDIDVSSPSFQAASRACGGLK